MSALFPKCNQIALLHFRENQLLPVLCVSHLSRALRSCGTDNDNTGLKLRLISFFTLFPAMFFGVAGCWFRGVSPG